MALLLILGLSLAAASGFLVLRAVGLAHADRRRTLDQIAAYDYRAETSATAEAAGSAASSATSP